MLHRAIDEVEHWLHAFAPDREAGVAMAAARGRKSFAHAIGKSTTLIGAFPPFPALMTDIALLGQPLRQRACLVYMRNENFPTVLACLLGVGLVGCCAGRVIASGLVLGASRGRWPTS